MKLLKNCIQFQFVLGLFYRLFTCQGQLTYDRAALRELAQFPQQHRFSEGRLCASLFAQNDRVYTNCTTAATPDGQTGREWCFLADQLRKKNEKNWGYCSPPVDYNFVRSKANEAFLNKINEISKILTKLDAERARLDDVLKRYNATCGRPREIIATRLGKIQQLLDKADRSLSQIEETRKKISSTQQAIIRLNEEVERQKNAPAAPSNCATLPGYEDDPFPDGLKANYYKNVYFKGEPLYQVDQQIDFSWAGKDPLPGISHQEFSIRWMGSIQAPYTGDYIFSTIADCGARVFINEQPIIVDRMPFPTSKEIANPHNYPEVPLLPLSEHDGPKKVSSSPITLNAGEKNLLRIEMIHSYHLKWANPEEASIRFLWSSSMIEEQTVPKEVFYQSNPKPLFKLSRINPDRYDVTYLYDGELAYKDSSKNFLADVPMIYYGLKVVRGVESPVETKFVFEINHAATLFVATPQDHNSPLLYPCEGSFSQLEDIISVYNAENRTSRATSVSYFSLYKLDLNSAGVFEFDILQAGIPFFVFFRPKKYFEGSCGGPMTLLSDPSNTKVFQSCEASSSSSPEYSCQYGLGRNQADQPFGTWRTSEGNGVGEFLAIRFKKKVQLSRLRFIPRNDPVTWPAELTVSFCEGSSDAMGKTKTFTISHAGNLDALRYSLNSVITNFIRIEISKMYVNGEETGGSFEVWGTECYEEEHQDSQNALASLTSEPKVSASSLIQLKQSKVIPMKDCTTTLENIPEAHPFDVGKHLTVDCPTSCLSATSENHSEFSLVDMELRSGNGSTYKFNPPNMEPSTFRVFGSNIYAPESSLCPAAIHMGLCLRNQESEKPLRCIVTVHLVKYTNSFIGELRNGIKSESHGPSEFAMVFGQSPSETSKPVQTNPTVSYGISFRSSDMVTPPQGYLIDDGKKFNSSTTYSPVAYGWERETQVVNCDYENIKNQNPLNTGGIEFPPDPQSTQCESSVMDCTSNSWKMYLPENGVYRIQVQVGNPCHPTTGTLRYYLYANTNPIVEGEDLPRGKYFWATEDISIYDNYLKLTAECPSESENEKERCNNAITTLMNLNITLLNRFIN